jgi:hypothetical protein
MQHNGVDLPVGVLRVVDFFSAEWPDDPSIVRTIHFMGNGDEVVFYDRNRDGPQVHAAR